MHHVVLFNADLTVHVSTGFKEVGPYVYAFGLSDSIRRLQGRLIHVAVLGWRKDSNTQEHEEVRIRSQQTGCCQLFVARYSNVAHSGATWQQRVGNLYLFSLSLSPHRIA